MTGLRKKSITYPVFFILLLTGCKTSIINNQWFPYPYPELKKENVPSPYIKLKSGEKISGNEISVSPSAYKRVKMDGKIYKAKEINEVYDAGGNRFVIVSGHISQQVSSGKISLYERRYTRSKTNSSGMVVASNEETEYWYSKDGGPIKPAVRLSDLRKMVQGCDKATALFDGAYLTVYKRLKQQPRLVYNAIAFYNNDCK